MTTLSITETLMNNYASIALLADNFYDKTYLDNQFSLKADVSQLRVCNHWSLNYEIY